MTIRYKRPDNKNALSIVQAAQEEMEFTLSITVNEKSGSTIIRNIYESFRMLGDALLINQGIASQDHIESIKELMRIDVKTERPIGILDNLRILRHNINYYGYRPKLKEVREIISIAKTLFNPIHKAVLIKLEKDNSNEYNGYFSKLLKKLGGDSVNNNLIPFKFRPEVLRRYKDLSKRNPLEFKFEERIGIHINYSGKWALKCSHLKNGNIGAILIDLSNIPTSHQEWWADHLIKN